MQRLEGFSHIAYDTNVLVYYCFEVNIPEANPRRFVCAELTPRTKTITETLKSKGQKITTILDAYRELQDVVNAAVVKEMNNPRVKKMLGIAENAPVRQQTVLHVQTAVAKHVKKLKNASWFVLNHEFTPSPTAFASLRTFFDSIPLADIGDSERASAVDIKLVNFGAVSQIPLVTNDGGIHKFSGRLQAAGLAYRIYDLKTLNPS